MTSLQETLPILDQAVPALPGKVEAVAREADSFEKTAREALASFEQKRAAAEGLLDQVRHALEAVRDQAAEARDATNESGRSLRDAAEEEARGLGEGAEALDPAGGKAEAAFQELEHALDQGADRVRAAHQQAREALDTLDEHTRTAQSELQQAAGEVAKALEDARQAVTEGQADVSEGVERLADAMARMLERVQTRLERTRSRLDALRDEQADNVADTLSGLVTRRQAAEERITTRLADDLPVTLDPELEALAERWGEVGQQAAQLEGDCRDRRQELEPQLGAVGDRIEPLTGAVVQVKQAADRVGLAWP